MSQTIHHQVVIVGGGTAGISVAARLTNGWFNKRDVAVIEPADTHYYQPLWTLVGGGVVPKEITGRPMKSVIPKRVHWIKDAVAQFEPDKNVIRTREGKIITYDWLVIAAGLQLNWDKIPGLKDGVTKNGVCSNYSYETVDSTWQNIKNFKGGTAIFTMPSGAVKCGGAPQKIMYLAEETFRRNGVRKGSTVMFTSTLPNIFAVDRYRKTLEEIIQRKQIVCHFREELIEIFGDRREAVFRNLDSGETISRSYDMLHVTPPMGPPTFIAKSSLADKDGWVDVDRATLQHKKFPNVFSIGDCSNLPTSKTGAAIRKQAPVLVGNLIAAMSSQKMSGKYDGYTSCPLVTGYGKLVMAEFDYDKKPEETFPIDQSKERWSMWLVKRYLLPQLYWHGMLKGWM
ncbi:MAG: NAD(P)/FAD-dependent oxidoreductase [Planctomycetota bacterium]|nr:MAG: NAD(P)/FAD-dependent oxidoreductase [Planctomycetota bacterium]